MPVHHVSSATSINMAKMQKYSIDSARGLKRTRGQLESDSHSHPIKQARLFNDESDLSSALVKHERRKLNVVEKNRIEASAIIEVNADNSRDTNQPIPSQRLVTTSTPRSSLNPLLSLSHPLYNLPESLVKNFSSLGIESIYPWQSSCLLGRGLLAGQKNLVYTAPTGGGKSLVADVLMLKRVIEDPTKKAILVLPYVALVQEKLKWLRQLVEGVSKNSDSTSQLGSQRPKRHHSNANRSIRIAGYFGGSKARANWSDVDIAVCTIEKVLNSALPQRQLVDRFY